MMIDELRSKTFVYSELVNNEFIVELTLKFHGIQYTAKTKLDTGAVGFLVPLANFGILSDDCKDIKTQYILRDYPTRPLRGIERAYNLSRNDYEKLSFEEKLSYKGVGFVDTVSGVTLNNLYIGNCSAVINVNDKSSYALLGMSILKKFDFHVGTSSITGKCTFIGCPKDNISDDYLQALSKHFNLVQPERALARFMRGEY